MVTGRCFCDYVCFMRTGLMPLTHLIERNDSVELAFRGILESCKAEQPNAIVRYYSQGRHNSFIKYRFSSTML